MCMTGEYVEDKNDDGRRLRIRMTSKMWREGHLFKDSVVETDKLPHQKESSLAPSPPCHVHYHIISIIIFIVSCHFLPKSEIVCNICVFYIL